MSKAEMIIALYKPKAGKAKELDVLVKNHFPILKECGLTTGREPFISRASDGTILEVFEWVSKNSPEEAHKHPAVAEIWEAMSQVSDFVTLKDLSESQKMFPHFTKAF